MIDFKKHWHCAIACSLFAASLAGCKHEPPPTPAQQMTKAIQLQDVAAVKQLLAQDKALANAPGEETNPPLHRAATLGNVELARLLIENGAEVNGTGKENPLLSAAENLHVEMVRLLLEKGADANVTQPRPHGDIWPMKAATSGMMSHGGLATIPPAEIQKGRAIIGLLLDHGAKPTKPWWHAEVIPAQYCVASIGDLPLLKRMVQQGFDLQAVQDTDHQTILHSAASGGNVEVIRWLLDQGVPVDDESFHFHWTPLHHAASSGHLEAVQVLVEEAGCKINGSGDVQRMRTGTPLHVAINSGQLEIARFLVQSGADLSLRNEDQLTPLGLALKRVENAANEKPQPASQKAQEIVNFLREQSAPE